MIKEHAVAVALAMREKGAADNDLFDRLAADGRLRPVPRRDRRAGRRPGGLRRARRPAQVEAVAERVAAVGHPSASTPCAILYGWTAGQRS